MKNKKRCNLHGGKSTGAPGNKNAWKHGRYSADAVAQEKELRAVLVAALTGLEGLH